MKKTALYIFAAIGLVSLLVALYSLIGMSGATMYGSSANQNGPIGAIPGGLDPNASYATLPQQQNLSETTPVAFAAQGSNASAPNSQANQAPTPSTMKRMIIRNANLTLEVGDINKALDEISNLANNSGGYVVSSNSNQDEQMGAYNSATISIRIPAEGLKKALAQLKAFSIKVKNEDISGEDITQKYVDLQSTLNNLQTAKNQLQKIMDGATKTADVLNVFNQLTNTQGQIDLVQGQIKYYSESVALSLITINLEMKPATAIEKIRSWELGKVCKEAYQSLLTKLEDLSYSLIRFVILFLPLLLIWAVIFLVLFFLGKALYRALVKHRQ